jgi:hypothetical protein
MRCLARDAASRWPDAGALRQQLLAGGTENDLPVTLQNVALYTQFGALALGFDAAFAAWEWAVGYGDFRFVTWQGEFNPSPIACSVFFIPALLGLVILQARRRGHPWVAIGRAMGRQPTWWKAWYPRGGRVPADVWSRLPAHVRVVRTLGQGSLLAFAILVLAWAIDVRRISDYGELGARARALPMPADATSPMTATDRAAPLFGMVGSLTLVALVWSFRTLRRGPLSAAADDAEIFAVYRRSTGDQRFWSQPVYQALLAPAPRPVQAPAGPAPTGATTLDRETATRTGGGSGR